MFKTPEEIEFAILIGALILGTFVIFIIAFIFLFKKRQNVLLTEQQLKDTEYENTLLKKELEKIKAVKKERERIGDDLHDDLGSRLSAIRLELEFLQSNFADKEVQKKMTGVVMQSRDLSGIIREVVWTLNAQYDSLDSFVIYTKEYVHNLLSITNIDLQTDIVEDIPKIELSNTTRRALFLAIKEALNNAIKHSDASILTITLSLTQNSLLRISIKDNGKGLKYENQFGNGLGSMQKRIETIGGNVSIQSSSRGTIVSISVTLQ